MQGPAERMNSPVSPVFLLPTHFLHPTLSLTFLSIDCPICSNNLPSLAVGFQLCHYGFPASVYFLHLFTEVVLPYNGPFHHKLWPDLTLLCHFPLEFLSPREARALRFFPKTFEVHQANTCHSKSGLLFLEIYVSFNTRWFVFSWRVFGVNMTHLSLLPVRRMGLKQNLSIVLNLVSGHSLRSWCLLWDLVSTFLVSSEKTLSTCCLAMILRTRFSPFHMRSRLSLWSVFVFGERILLT